jgi:hypothetical protein
MVRGAALAVLCCACAHTHGTGVFDKSFAEHHFPVTVEQAQATLATQLKWPATPFGTYDVVFDAQSLGDGAVELRVNITNQFADGRPSHLATIDLVPDGEGSKAKCVFEQPDANCPQWVWNALGGGGMEEAQEREAEEADKRANRREEREKKQEEKRLAAYQVEYPGNAVFKPEWKSSFTFGLAAGGNEQGAAAGLILRGGVRRLHTPRLDTAYLLEYQFTGQTAKPGGGWTSLVVPTFHVEMPFLITHFPRPPAAYVLVAGVASIDIDKAPGSGIGVRGGLGLRADWYFLEAYIQYVWLPTSGGTGVNYFGAVGIGF